MRAAVSGSLRMVESASILMVRAFLVARSLTVISAVCGLIAVTVAAIWRKVPKAILSAWMAALSSLLLPSTRNWSPGLISGKLLGLASLKRAEAGEYRWQVDFSDGCPVKERVPLLMVAVLAAASMAVTVPVVPRFFQSS